MKKLVLFDIDGTLLWTDGAGRSAIRLALMAELGTAGPIDDFRFDGKTDPQIVRQLMTAAKHPEAESKAHILRVCERYAELLAGELTARDRRIRVFDGVFELLDVLESREDAVLGLLTGNVERGAFLKLRAGGIDPHRFRVGAYGSDAEHRPDLPAIAAQRALEVIGRVPEGDQVVIVGDTPADVACGRRIGARAIAVATGSYSVADLDSAGAFATFESFADPIPVVNAIFA
ncbi:MAG: HAD family hydrolase [Gemmatimonadales bacterium]